MSRTTEKLSKFSEMVMQEANRKKIDIIKQAELDKKELIAASEINYLKNAYEKIQDAIRKIEKDMNEDISKAILESKQALFNRRDEIVDAIFSNVSARILEFRQSEPYRQTIEKLLKRAFEEVGEGDIRVSADAEDIALFETIRGKMGQEFKIIESEDNLLGGFLLVNRSKGFMWDYSFRKYLDEERLTFLERYEFSLE